jgi:DNA-binding NtrC family response regulator
MKNQSILVADKDTAFLRDISSGLTGAGYDVETTTSTVHVISNILKKKTPVVLLGSDFDNRIDLVDLVRLLKKCNQHLAVILVSDEASFPGVQKIRKEGIFYYAMRPVNAEDREEIKNAAICACKSVARDIQQDSPVNFDQSVHNLPEGV